MDNELLVQLLKQGVEIVDEALPQPAHMADKAAARAYELRGVAYGRVLDVLIKNARLNPPSYPVPQPPDQGADQATTYVSVVLDGGTETQIPVVGELTVQKLIATLEAEAGGRLPENWQIHDFQGTRLSRDMSFTGANMPLHIGPPS